MNSKQQAILIQGCAEGLASSQRKLFMMYSEELLSTCKRYMSNEQEAKDILQDSFIRIFRYAHTFNPEGGNLKGWMKTICIRESLRQLKKKKPITSLEDIEQNLSVNPEIVQVLDTEELHMLIASLPQKQRTIFNLFVIEGYSHREIAKMLNLEESCSRSILSRSKKALKNKLSHINLGNSNHNYRYAV